MDRETVQRALQLQRQHADLAYIPRPNVFWHSFHANDHNTHTLLEAFEAISKSGLGHEARIREELLMMCVCHMQTNRFRIRHLNIDLRNARKALYGAMRRIHELETQVSSNQSTPPWSLRLFLIRLFAPLLRSRDPLTPVQMGEPSQP